LSQKVAFSPFETTSKQLAEPLPSFKAFMSGFLIKGAQRAEQLPLFLWLLGQPLLLDNYLKKVQ
jgi:hypothetical protein